MKTVWLIEVFDEMECEAGGGGPSEIKVALTKKRALEHTKELAEEYLEWLLDNEPEAAVLESAPKIVVAPSKDCEIYDAEGTLRWTVSVHETEVV